MGREREKSRAGREEKESYRDAKKINGSRNRQEPVPRTKDTLPASLEPQSSNSWDGEG